MNKKRLMTLIHFMETKVPKEHFDMSLFTNGTAPTLRKDCGTSACALGWATAIPSFKRAGLAMRSGLPAYGDAEGFKAASFFFDLIPIECSMLFSNEDCRMTPKQWAKMARKHIREWSEHK